MISGPGQDTRRVLVTGGAGFIGSHLVRRLVDGGFTVRVLDALTAQVHGPGAGPPAFFREAGVEFLHGSVTQRGDCERALAGIDHVVHLAAETGTGQSMYEVAKYTEVNVLGTAMLFDVLANQPHGGLRRFVLASSRAVYGEGAYHCPACRPQSRMTPGSRPAPRLDDGRWEPACPSCGGDLAVLPTLESDTANPASVYAATKRAQEDLVQCCCPSLAVGYAVLRLQNVFGEGQSLQNPYTGLLSIFSNRIRQGRVLPIFEDGLETRDFVHVSDVAEAMLRCLEDERPVHGVVNVGSGVATTILEAARQLSVALDAPARIEVTGQYRLGDIRHNVADITRLRMDLGYAPRVGFAEGLARFGAWVRQQPLHVDRLEGANEEMRARGLMRAAK